MEHFSVDTVTEVYPERKWFDIDLKGLWRYRDLFAMYVERNIVVYYKQTIFGPLWYFVQPVLTTIMYIFVFGNLAGLPTDGVPRALFYLAGTTLWNYSSQCFNSCCDVFGTNAGVFGKVWFPRIIVPLASSVSGLIRFAMQSLIFIIVYICFVAKGLFSFSPDISILALPFIVIAAGLQGMALGLICSAWTVKYKDLLYLLTFLVQLVMYATPVIYPLSLAPERYRWIMNLNPLTPLFESFKYCCLGVGTFSVGGMLYSLGFLAVSLFLSVIIFNKAEQKFIDTI